MPLTDGGWARATASYARHWGRLTADQDRDWRRELDHFDDDVVAHAVAALARDHRTRPTLADWYSACAQTRALLAERARNAPAHGEQVERDRRSALRAWHATDDATRDLFTDAALALWHADGCDWIARDHAVVHETAVALHATGEPPDEAVAAARRARTTGDTP